jgi:ribosomal protein L37AE/L43A
MKKEKRYKKINPFTFFILKTCSKFISKFKLNLKILRNDLNGNKGGVVILSNHEYPLDFVPICSAVNDKIHFVISNAMLKSMPIYKIMLSAGVIGKNQFATSVSSMRAMKAVLEDGKKLCLFPAGLMPEHGASTPVPKSTAKTIKWFDSDVYISKITGTYLSKPKWSSVFRKGKTTLEIYKLFSKEELKNIDTATLQSTIEKHLFFDAYRNNDKARVYYKNGDNVEGLETVLYKCPNCGKDYAIKVKDKNVLECTDCGYSVKSDNYGILHQNGKTPIIYKYVSDWYNYQEKCVFEKVSSTKDFKISTLCEIHKINDKKHKFEKVGDGEVTLNLENFIISGTVYNKDFYKEVFAQNFPMLPFIPGKRFEIQDGEDIYRIVPQNPIVTTEWILTLKAVHKLANKS